MNINPAMKLLLGQPFATTLNGENVISPPPLIERLEFELRERLTTFCSDLGIRSEPTVSVCLTDNTAPVIIEVPGIRVCVDEKEVEYIAASFASDHIDDSDRYTGWQFSLDQLVEQATDPENKAILNTLVEVVVEVVVSSIDNHADRFFSGDELIDAAKKQPNKSGLEERHIPLLTKGVRAALQLHTPIKDTSSVIRIVAESVRCCEDPASINPEDIGEELAAQLRPSTFTISANESYAKQVLGFATEGADGNEVQATFRSRQYQLMAWLFFNELGVRPPVFKIETDSLPDRYFSLQIGLGNPRRYRGVPEGYRLYFATPHDRIWEDLKTEPNPALDPATRALCSIASKEHKDEADNRRILSLDPMEFVMQAALVQLRKEAWRTPHRDLVDFGLSRLEREHPDLIQTAMARMSSPFLTRVLRELLRDQISILNLPDILETLLRIDMGLLPESWSILAKPPEFKKDPVLCAELVRTELQSYICHKYTRGHDTLTAYLLLDSEFEALYEAGLEDVDALRKCVREKVSEFSLRPFIIVTSMAIRRQVSDIIRGEFPMGTVLSFQELTPKTHANVRPIDVLRPTQFGAASSASD